MQDLNETARKLKLLEIDDTSLDSPERSGVLLKSTVAFCVTAAAVVLGATTYNNRHDASGIAIRDDVESEAGAYTSLEVLPPKEEVDRTTATGFVVAKRQATVSAEITGKVKEIFVAEGMRVSKGYVLATLDKRTALAALEDFRNQLAVAEANSKSLRLEMEYQKSELVRFRVLRSGQFITESELRLQENRVEVLDAKLDALVAGEVAVQAKLELANLTVEQHTIRSPFSGVVSEVNVQPGEVISPFSAGGSFTRTGVCTIVDVSSLSVEVDLPEGSVARISVGDSAEISLTSVPGEIFSGKIESVSPIADRNRASLKVSVVFDAIDSKIRPESTARVTFLGTEE